MILTEVLYFVKEMDKYINVVNVVVRYNNNNWRKRSRHVLICFVYETDSVRMIHVSRFN